MCNYLKQEIYFEDIPVFVLVKEETKIEENPNLDVIKEEYDKDHQSELCPNPTANQVEVQHVSHCSFEYLGKNSNEAPFPCDLCGKKCLDKEDLERHAKSHSEERNHKCNECDRAFKTKLVLSQHKRILHPTETPFQCEVCSKGFSTLALLKKHSAKHNEEKPYKCDKCSIAFKWKTSLILHIKRLHPSGTPFQCKFCSKCFSERSLLKTHSVEHKDEKLYKCDQCSYSCKWKHNLNLHKSVVHLNERNFACELCEKKFVRQPLLKEHLLRHSISRNYKCSECMKPFKTKKDLARHFRNLHSTVTPFQCEVCLRSFSKLAYLKMHFLMHSNARPIQWDLWRNEFKANDALNQHKTLTHGAPQNELNDALKGVDVVNEVKVEPVVIYDPEEKIVFSEMDVEVKQEPEESEAN